MFYRSISCYDEGGLAYNKGLLRVDNPYDPETPEYDDWDDGWLDERDIAEEDHIHDV